MTTIETEYETAYIDALTAGMSEQHARDYAHRAAVLLARREHVARVFARAQELASSPTYSPVE